MADGITSAGQDIANAILTVAKQRREAQERSAKALLDAGTRDPAILDDPNVFKSIKKYAGDDQTAKALIETSRSKSLPGQASTMLGTLGISEETIRQVVAPGSMPLPQGVPGPVQPAPSQTQMNQAALGALPEIAQQKGFGVEISPTGLKLRQSPPTRAEVGEMAGYEGWVNIREQLATAVPDPAQRDQLAAKLAIPEMARSGVIPPPWLRELALATTETEIQAAREKAQATVRAGVERETAAGIESEKRRGAVLGEAAGKAAIPFQTFHVTRPDGTTIDIPLEQAGAFAATGVESAVSLGTSPSKEQMEAAALRGNNLFVGPRGDIISVPVGQAPNLPTVPAEALLRGSESFAAIDDMNRILSDIEANPNFRASAPDEKALGREVARGAGWVKSWVRGLTDPAETMTQRGELAKSGFRLARLAGSNSQLSDAERDNAQKVLKPLIDGTYTQQIYDAALKNIKAYLTLADKRRRTGEKAEDGFDAVTGKRSKPTNAPKQSATKAAVASPMRSSSLGDRQNNPGHVKVTAFTRRLPGFVGEGKAAKDGGKFAIFDSVENGRNAIDAVLTRIHGSKTLRVALKQYSGSGYNVDRVAADAGVDPNARVRDLSEEQRSTLIDAMIGAEGSSTGLSRRAQAAKLADAVNAGKMTADEAAKQLRVGG